MYVQNTCAMWHALDTVSTTAVRIPGVQLFPFLCLILGLLLEVTGRQFLVSSWEERLENVPQIYECI
jgi:hypothetical protein